MQKLQIKIKYLILIIILIVAALSLPIIFKDRILLNAAQRSTSEMQNALLDKIVRETPGSELVIKAALMKYDNYLKELNRSFMDDWVMFDQDGSVTGGGKSIFMNDVTRINNEFLTISALHNGNKDLDQLKLQVALLNWYGGNSSKALELLDEVIANNREESERALVYKAIMSIMLGNMNLAHNILDKENSFDRYELLARTAQVYADRLEANPQANNREFNLNDIRDNFRNLNTNGNRIYGFDEEFFRFISSSDLLTVIKNRWGSNTVGGRITLDNKPLGHIVVGIKANDDHSSSSPVQYNNVIDYTITDSNGCYALKNLADGDYRIVMFVPRQRVDDYYLPFNMSERFVTLNKRGYKQVDFNFVPVLKVNEAEVSDDEIKFSWEIGEKCEEYSLAAGLVNRDMRGNITGTTMYIRITGIKDNYYEADLKNLRDGGMKSYQFDSQGIIPQYLFEDFYLGGQYTFVVNGYDDKGNIIASSRGFLSNGKLPLFIIKGQRLSEPDILLLERKYDQARDKYQADLEGNPDNTHACSMLEKIKRSEQRKRELNSLHS